MKQNKKIIKINLIPLPSSNDGVLGRQPGIYIHYYQGKVQYVGETVNVYDGRPFRASRGEPVDTIRWLRASNNDTARKGWEAYLVVRLKPARQNVRHYAGAARLTGWKEQEERWIEQRKEERRKITRRVCNLLRSTLKEFSEAQRGHIPLSQRDIELKRRTAWEQSSRAITKLVNAEDKMVQWHNDLLYNYATNKRRIIENELFGPIKQ